jgi:hypothetical protein
MSTILQALAPDLPVGAAGKAARIAAVTMKIICGLFMEVSSG